MSLLDSHSIVKILQPKGALSSVLSSFEPRKEQEEVLLTILEAMNTSSIALIEAGTGTGKTFAYLIPILMAAFQKKEKTLLSTNTIHLQEQILFKDIPVLLKALNIKIKIALLKGMGNYICLKKLDEEIRHQQLDEDKKDVFYIQKLLPHLKEGTKNELPFLPSNQSWDKVKAEHDLCLSSKCPMKDSCFFLKARKEAQEADLIIVNHHLLFSDLASKAKQDKDEGLKGLPDVKHILLDEAHTLEEIAIKHLSERLNEVDIAKVLFKLSFENARKENRLSLFIQKLNKLLETEKDDVLESIQKKLLIDFSGIRTTCLESLRIAFSQLEFFFRQETSFLKTEENKLRIKEKHLSHAFWTDKITPLFTHLKDYLLQMVRLIENLDTDFKTLQKEMLEEEIKLLRLDLGNLAKKLQVHINLIDLFFSTPLNPSIVRWMEIEKIKDFRNVHLIEAKLNLASLLENNFFQQNKSITLISATLSSNNSFDYLKKRLGLNKEDFHQNVVEKIVDSPFNFQKQASFFSPKDLPEPSHPSYLASIKEKILDAVRASNGGAFILFTSYKMLEEVFCSLEKELNQEGFNLFKQGTETRSALIEAFKTTKKNILFGTDSFWEGVDVQGDALRMVIIVKLPFKVPSDPIFEAQSEKTLLEGGDPFSEYSLPQAVVKFKQGFGRLIRNKNDFGCVICLDPRLFKKGYGKIFLNSLPQCDKLFVSAEEWKTKLFQTYQV